MINPKWLAALLCSLLLTAAAYAQDSTFATSILSKPTDLPLTGWNKTLMLHDGKTFVLHIAPWEKMQVKIFDSTRKEIASIKQLFKVINEKEMDESAFKGLYEIDGKPVLFMNQLVNKVNSLVRISFNPETGAIHDEVIMMGSNTAFPENAQYQIAKDPDHDSYAIYHGYPFLADKPSGQLLVSFWNGKHQLVRKNYITLPEKIEWGLDFIGMMHNSQAGTYVALGINMPTKKMDISDHVLLIAGAQPGEQSFNTQLINFRQAQLKYGLIQFNPFSSTIEIGLSCTYVLDKGKDYYRGMSAMFLTVLDKETLTTQMVRQIAHGSHKKSAIDSNFIGHGNGFPIRMFTNKQGITTLVSESATMGYNAKNNSAKETILGPLNFKKLDEHGDELYDVVLPKSQSVANYLYPVELAFRGTNKYLFRDDPVEAYDNQFTSFEHITAQHCNYIILNDYEVNYPKHSDERWDMVRNFPYSEAFCYKIDGNNELKRSYLFGAPGNDMSRAVLIESMDMRMNNRNFTTLVSERKGKITHLCVAWCQLN